MALAGEASAQPGMACWNGMTNDALRSYLLALTRASRLSRGPCQSGGRRHTHHDRVSGRTTGTSSTVDTTALRGRRAGVGSLANGGRSGTPLCAITKEARSRPLRRTACSPCSPQRLLTISCSGTAAHGTGTGPSASTQFGCGQAWHADGSAPADATPKPRHSSLRRPRQNVAVSCEIARRSFSPFRVV